MFMINNKKSRSARVLVTGASGFLGKHMVMRLLDEGYKVIAHQYLGDLPPEIQKRCERVHTGDICDLRVQRDILQDVQVVCHLAACIPTHYIGLQEAGRCYKINSLATLELATIATEVGVRRFIFYSTGNMYANSDRPLLETNRIFPTGYATDYMVSKLAAEIYLTNICQRFPMETVILRIGTPFGPGEPSGKVIPTFLRRAAQGQSLHLVNGGIATYNFVYVDDVIDISIKAIEISDQGTFNVASGEHTNLLELAHIVTDLYENHEVPLIIEPSLKGGFEGFPNISITKAKKVFEFSPRSLSMGLQQYRKNLEKNSNWP